MAKLSSTELAYLDMIEAEGSQDWAASVFGHLLFMESVPDEVIEVLSGADRKPTALLRATTTLAENNDPQMLWVAELFLLIALTLTANSGDPDEVTCLLEAGRFYASTDQQTSVRFLDAARRTADGLRSKKLVVNFNTRTQWKIRIPIYF